MILLKYAILSILFMVKNDYKNTFKSICNYNSKMKWKDTIEEYLFYSTPTPKHTTHFHMAFLLLRGNIVAVSTNQIGSRSRGAGYSEYTLHAERAVMKQIDVSQLKNMTLVVIRLGKNGTFLNSKPCPDCQRVLKKYGCKVCHS